jgi:hypothetical protein
MPKRVPKEPTLFDKYIKRVVNLLFSFIPGSTSIKWGTNLGLSSTEMTEIQNFLIEWYTGNPLSPGAYELHTDTYGITQTKATTQAVNDIITNFSEFFAPLLTRMSGSANITPAIRITLHIGDANPPHVKHEDEITEQCHVKVTSTTGEKVKLECTADTSSKRPSIPKGQGSLEVEVAYSIKPPVIDTTGKVMPPVSPVGPEDTSLTLWETSTKATFFLCKIPVGSTGKLVQGFARWADIHNMKRRGPWTPIPPTQIN